MWIPVAKGHLYCNYIQYQQTLLTKPISAFSAAWFTADVKHVSVKTGNGCVLLEGGEVIKIDLQQESGKAEFSLALAAFTAKKKLQVYQTDEPLVGGCNSGTTIKPHSMLNIID